MRRQTIGGIGGALTLAAALNDRPGPSVDRLPRRPRRLRRRPRPVPERRRGVRLRRDGGRALSEAAFTVDAASVLSNHEGRDTRIRGADFLDAGAHPEIRFVMSEARRTGVLTGDPTLRGVARPIDVQVTWNKSGAHPFGGTYVMGVTAQAVAQRRHCGGDEAPIEIVFEAVRQD